MGDAEKKQHETERLEKLEASDLKLADIVGLPGWWDRLDGGNEQAGQVKAPGSRGKLFKLLFSGEEPHAQPAKDRGDIQRDLELRYSLLEAATKRLKESILRTRFGAACSANPAIPSQLGQPSQVPHENDQKFHLPSASIWQMATIDVFVEKAQGVLHKRSIDNKNRAFLMINFSIIVMLAALVFGYFEFQPSGDGKDWSTVVTFLGHAALLGVILGIAYFLSSLARAFLHESTILENRRHSVRLGRLYLHLKVSSAENESKLGKIIDALEVADLERCFGWNLETSTAFKDIKPEAMTTGLVGQLLSSGRKAL
jgi:hypothetical protein